MMITQTDQIIKFPPRQNSMNIACKPNLLWSSDQTNIEIPQFNTTFYIYIILDHYTNCPMQIVGQLKEPYNGEDVKRVYNLAFDQIDLKPQKYIDNRLLIIHDKGIEHTNKILTNFFNQYVKEKKIDVRVAQSLGENNVIERYNKTLKYIKCLPSKVKNKKINLVEAIQELDNEQTLEADLNKFLEILKTWLENIKNSKTIPGISALEQHQLSIATNPFFDQNASNPRAHSAYLLPFQHNLELLNDLHLKKDLHTLLQDFFKLHSDNNQLTVRDMTELFTWIMIKVNESQTRDLKVIIEKQGQQTVQQIQQTSEKTNEKIDKQNKIFGSKLDLLLERDKSGVQTHKPRIPLKYLSLQAYYDCIRHCGLTAERQPELRRAQFRVIFTILFFFGTRINEIRTITYEQIQTAITKRYLPIPQSKTESFYKLVVDDYALYALMKLQPELRLLFEGKNKLKFLGSSLNKKDKALHKNAFKSIINQELIRLEKLLGWEGPIRTHSFRIKLISTALQTKERSIREIMKLVNHKNPKATLSYEKYILSDKKKKQLQEIIQKFPYEEFKAETKKI